MRRRGAVSAGLVAVVLLGGGCAGDAPDAGGQDTASSADVFYERMQVGDYAGYTDDGLDEIAKAFCSDLGNLTAEQRESTVIVLRQSVDTDQEAFEVGQAITERWCPEYRDLYDY